MVNLAQFTNTEAVIFWNKPVRLVLQRAPTAARSHGWWNRMITGAAVQTQRTVTDYLKSKQLLLFTIALKYCPD